MSLQIEDIYKSYAATPALAGVSLEVPQGTFASIVGPSGCGKSTLLKVISGLETAEAGRVTLHGRDLTGLTPRVRDVAMVFQSYALYPNLTVSGNIAFPLRMGRLGAWGRLPLPGFLRPGSRVVERQIAAEVAEVAGLLQIAPLLDRKPAQLSGGQRQRVALARAMVRRPRAFLMDEPLSNLDAALRVEMRREIRELHDRLGVTTLYVTHDQGEAMTLSDLVVVMAGGRVLQVAPPLEIYRRPAWLAVATFIGTPRINLLPAAAGRGTVGSPLGDFDSTGPAAAGAATLAVRPEHLHLAPAGEAGLPARVTQVEQLGPEALVQLASLDGDLPLFLRSDPERARGLAPGQAVTLRADAQHLLLFDAEGRRLDQPLAERQAA